MGTDYLIVANYIESLKEDGELDALFPILLELMGFKIVSTPKHSKGQPQFGKDIIAIGYDEQRVKHKFFFELKGHADKDIDDTVYSKPDGIRDSLIAMKDAEYQNKSIPGFDGLPAKYILVHNGILKSNTEKTFNGFINKNFKEGEFERWGIRELTELFSRYMFGEYLLTDTEGINLLKRTLVLLDSPEYELVDFKLLVCRLLDNDARVTTRAFKKMFASLHLIGNILFHYCKEGNNLTQAKNGINYLLLKTWAWILKMKFDKKEAVKVQFRQLLRLQFEIYSQYINKTIDWACEEDGLFSEHGGFFEQVGYPLRSFEYLNDLLYYCKLRQSWPKFNGITPVTKQLKLTRIQKEYLKKIVNSNSGCARPLIDAHYIPFTTLTCFFLESIDFDQDDYHFIAHYLFSLMNNLTIIRAKNGRWPEMRNNLDKLVEYCATNKRPSDYFDNSSVLLTVLIELIVLIDAEKFYSSILENFKGEYMIDLQMSYPNLNEIAGDNEAAFFDGNVSNNMHVETSIILPKTAEDFRKEIMQKDNSKIVCRTDLAGFGFLKFLSCMFFKNDIFPVEWRRIFHQHYDMSPSVEKELSAES